MKHRTIKNMHKAIKMIMAKGYCKEEANNFAIECFNISECNSDFNFNKPVEWYIEKIPTKSEWESNQNPNKHWLFWKSLIV